MELKENYPPPPTPPKLLSSFYVILPLFSENEHQWCLFLRLGEGKAQGMHFRKKVKVLEGTVTSFGWG